MQYKIEHEVPGHVRVSLDGRIASADIDALSTVIVGFKNVCDVSVYPRIGSVSLTYAPATDEVRQQVLDDLATLDQDMIDGARSDYAFQLAPRSHSLFMDLAELVGFHFLRKWFLPAWMRAVWAIWHYRKYLAAAFKSLLAGRLDVPVLDAAAIGISFIQGDPATASSTMFLLDLEDTLEEYTRAQSQNELIYSLLAVPEKAQLVEGKQERQVKAADLQEGDLIVIRTGQPVPIDGRVESGVAMVNQAALTGEPLPVERAEGDDVYAGTAIDTGEIYVRVRKSAGKTKLRSIVSLVEQSKDQQSLSQQKRDRLADAIVPWNFLLALIVGLATRDIVKVAASLMVDYSCALKLTASVSELAAMSESAKRGFTVKGSRSFELLDQADTIVFDKTGTLTEATPHVKNIIGFNGWHKDRVLRLAACLEEHYPHPVASAVVRAAAEHNLKHRERHAEVEYVVAHGLASSLDGMRVVIGSRHFVVEDEHVDVSEEQHALVNEELAGLSALYLAVDGQLVGVIGIEDPLKPGAIEAVRELRELGFEHVVMLTGDNMASAKRVAEIAGITEFEANMLPEDKHGYVARLRQQGRHVVMVGDGVNDSPALAAADVGIAMASGTAIAREVADITLTDSDLQAVVNLRRISMGLMRRFDTSYRFIMGWNSALLALGIAGVITPQTSALLHNGSTVLLGALSTRRYLPEEDSAQALPAPAADAGAAPAAAVQPAIA